MREWKNITASHSIKKGAIEILDLVDCNSKHFEYHCDVYLNLLEILIYRGG